MGYRFENDPAPFRANVRDLGELKKKFEAFRRTREEAEDIELGCFAFGRRRKGPGGSPYHVDQIEPVERIPGTYEALAEFLSGVLAEGSRVILTAADDDGPGEKVGVAAEHGAALDVVWVPYVGTDLGEVHVDDWLAGKER